MTTQALQNTNTCTPVSRCETHTYVPAVDIFETADEVLLLADLPGADAARIDVQFDRGRLTLRAPIEPRHSGNHWLLREYGVGDYERSFEVGEQIAPEGIRAEYAGGVLTLHLPKTERARTRKIEVRAN
jgi:HSP20 family molecular chaperone IbpA